MKTTFSDAEKAAMREHAREVRTSAKRDPRTAQAEAERDVLAKIAEMEPADRAIGERLHAIITAAAPGLAPKLWYGMPAYARDGKVVCFYQCARKFNSRYATLGFSDEANLDDGAMWPSAFALTELTAADEERIAALVARAAR
ncbi:iron chaperone [Dactylosporangium sp. CA-139066]|uniref:iron chaperone n=1 Tax=Dactylosporangium sp. CA-139066 TaxID=3239930 RepID=UPI003D90AB65